MTVDSNTQPIALQPPNSPYLIRGVKVSDLQALRQGCWAHYSHTQSQEILETMFHAASEQRGLGIVVEGKQQIIAYGQIMLLTKCLEISNLIVSEAKRSQGIGTAMIQYLIQGFQGSRMSHIEIGVAASNPRALALYKRLGFIEAYTLSLNLGNGREPVIYLSLKLA